MIRETNINIIHDDDYRHSLHDVIDPVNYKARKISLVDMVIRNILKDINIRIDFMATSNKKDFADLCALREIEII
jgi:hypothetical protein